MVRLCKGLTIGISVWLLCLPAFGREAKLEIRVPKTPAASGKCLLLPAPESLVEGDAVAWYEKAAQALPSKENADQVKQWLDMPVGQLPLQQVEDMLQKYQESLKYVAKAARCKDCKWPDWKPGETFPGEQSYRPLAWAIALWARLETARQEYDGALLALQTGFGMTRHLGQVPIIVQTLLGTAVGGVMCKEVEQFIQGENAPNLYPALAGMPKPFIDVEKAIEAERKANQAANPQLQQQVESQLKAAYDRSRMVTRSVDVNLGILQCVEAIRSYAASHGGQLPQSLNDMAGVSLPKDPVSGEPFRYTRTGATAVLESAIPTGGTANNRFRYEIAVKN